MVMAACRRCPNCKLYSDITVQTCMCGNDLSDIKQVFIDVDKDAFKNNLGEINESLSYFVQRCSSCGELNYTTSSSRPFLRCYKCANTMIASVAPAIFTDSELTENIPQKNDIASSVGTNKNSRSESVRVSLVKPKKVISSVPDKSKPESVKIPESPSYDITLTAVNYGSFTYSIKSANAKTPVMLGRESLLGNYLKVDKRVGKEHCSLIFNNKTWYVADNSSANGTFVNNQYIGYKGVTKLNEGDLIKFGHSPDSPEVKVSIST